MRIELCTITAVSWRKDTVRLQLFLILEQKTDPSQLFKDFVVHNSPFISPFRYFWRLAFEPLLPSSSHFSLACVAWPYFFYRSALSSGLPSRCCQPVTPVSRALAYCYSACSTVLPHCKLVQTVLGSTASMGKAAEEAWLGSKAGNEPPQSIEPVME